MHAPLKRKRKSLIGRRAITTSWNNFLATLSRTLELRPSSSINERELSRSHYIRQNAAFPDENHQEQACRQWVRYQRQQSPKGWANGRNSQEQKGSPASVETVELQGDCGDTQEEKEEDLLGKGVGYSQTEHDHTRGRGEAEGQEEGQGVCRRQSKPTHLLHARPTANSELCRRA